MIPLDRWLRERERELIELDRFLDQLEPSSWWGRVAAERLGAYGPGEENALRRELGRLGRALEVRREHPEGVARLRRRLEDLPPQHLGEPAEDLQHVAAVYRAAVTAEAIQADVAALGLDDALGEALPDLEPVLARLDPAGARETAFFLGDGFSAKLEDVRTRLARVTAEREQLRRSREREIAADLDLDFIPDDGLAVDRSHGRQAARCAEHPGLRLLRADEHQMVFGIVPTDEQAALEAQWKTLCDQEGQEEARVLEQLAGELRTLRSILEPLEAWLSRLDLLLAKAELGMRHDCIVPRVGEAPEIVIEDGVQPFVAARAQAAGYGYCPLSLELGDGIHVLTGSNMSGKSHVLRTICFLQALGQMGFAVPARGFSTGLFERVFISVPDTESPGDGLSTFGGEVRFVAEALSHRHERTLYLFDEIAAGTSIEAATTLNYGILDQLHDSPSVAMVATHIEAVRGYPHATRFVTGGLVRERVETYRQAFEEGSPAPANILRCIDFRIYKEGEHATAVDDALLVARLFGVDEDVVLRGRRRLATSNRDL